MFVNARSRFVAPADCPWSGSWTIKLIEVKSVLMNSVKVTSKKCASWISRDSEVDQHFDSSSLIADTLYREISWRFLKYQCGIGFWTGEIARVNSCFFHFFFLFLLGCCYWRCTFNSGPPPPCSLEYHSLSRYDCTITTCSNSYKELILQKG